MSKQITSKQIQEWTESPVTEYLATLVNQELESIQDTPVTDALFYGEPVKTHENLVDLEARQMAWSELALLLEGDWSYFEEEEDDEQVRSDPEGG